MEFWTSGTSPMSKKPKRSRHRIPTLAFAPISDPVDERYQIEVDYSTNRLQRKYAQAVKAKERAEKKLQIAIQRNERKAVIREFQRKVEIAEYERLEILKLMQPGTRSKVPWKPVPVTHGMI